jgi:hypothetical protein
MTPADDTIASLADRRMSVDEFDAYINAPISASEREAIESLIVWFTRRYPDALSRLISNRRAWRNAMELGNASNR